MAATQGEREGKGRKGEREEARNLRQAHLDNKPIFTPPCQRPRQAATALKQSLWPY